MPESYLQHEAIEGDKVSGDSRDPLIPRGLVNHNGHRCNRFVAKFNVKAKVTSPAEVALLEPNANLSMGDSIKCDKATIHSMTRKYRADVVHGSASHKTNAWSFSDRTSARIESPHQELIDGMRNRLLDEFNE